MKFTILITPQSVQHGARARLVRRPYPRIVFYNDDAKSQFMDSVVGECKHLMPKEPLEGPLAVGYKFYLPRPKTGKNSKPPKEEPEYAWAYAGTDVGNIEKGVTDSLTKAGAWKNDCQIAKVTAEKFYAEEGLFPRIEVEILNL